MAAIKKVGHVVLGVRTLSGPLTSIPMRSVWSSSRASTICKWRSSHSVSGTMISRSSRSQKIAVGSSGLAHTALEIDGGVPELRELYERLKSRGVEVEFTADHVLTKSFYFLDPDGNRLEIFSQALPASEAKQFLHDVNQGDAVMGPLDLEKAPA